MPLIIAKGYDTVGMCDCCHSENVGTKKFEAQPFIDKPERNLCYLCAATMAGTYHMSRSHYEVFPVIETVCAVGNMILKAVKGIPLDEPEPDEPEDSDAH